MLPPQQKEVIRAIEQSRADALFSAREASQSEGAGDALKDTASQAKKSKGVFSALRSGASLALKHRQRIKEGDFSVFVIPFTFALAKDGLLDLVPILGKVIGIFVTAYLFIFLWGRGVWMWRIVRALLLLIDALVPFLSILPFSTFCVFVTYLHAKKDSEKAKTALQKLGMEF